MTSDQHVTLKVADRDWVKARVRLLAVGLSFLSLAFSGSLVWQGFDFSSNLHFVPNRSISRVSALLEPDDEARHRRGQEIYVAKCATCHGDRGEGVEGAYATALVGDDSLGQLTRVISDTMPEGAPEECQGEDAEAVAFYMHREFYSEAAQLRNRPPQKAFARLTGNQLRQSYADLYAALADGLMWSKPERGIQGVYFNGEHWNNDEKKIERVDPTVDFDFGHAGPGSEIQPKKFYILWSGGLKVDHTGEYELVVHGSTSFMLHFGRDQYVLFDNHVQSGNQTEFRRSIYLTAGRIYPLRLEMRQRERKTETPPAFMKLAWVPPGGSEEIIPAHNLIPGGCPPSFALQATLPPDDQTYGYARGLLVSGEWDQATTRAALEFSDAVASDLWPKFREQYQKDHPEAPEPNALRAFLTKIIQKAFRFPLNAEQEQRYVGQAVERQSDSTLAIKQCLLLALKSPYFLYPTAAESDVSRSRRVVNRLALVLFDSLPIDEESEQLAAQESLSEQDIRNYVWGKWNDFRVQAKYREMLYQWMHLDASKELRKNSEVFPGFSLAVARDLRQSFDLELTELLSSSESDLRTLFANRTVYTTPVLQEFYGDTWAPDPAAPSGSRFVRALPDEQRAGILTHPYFTSSLSYHNATSPIHRGIVLYKYLFGRSLRPPADDFAPLSPDLHPNLTTRQRVELQTSPESCQVCHHKINNLGFVLENYDAVGRYRREEQSQPINAAGLYVDRDGQEQTLDGIGSLAEYLANSREMHRAFVNRAFQHFTKQPPAAYGPDVLDRLTDSFTASNCNLSNLLVEIAIVAVQQEESVPSE
jgi:mono/diheme cytochrome c family protein